MKKNARRLHRSVVLPDYQGIGIGMNFKNAVCDILRKEGWGGKYGVPRQHLRNIMRNVNPKNGG
jgi:GNAT superfamily N-acetyltransferase